MGNLSVGSIISTGFSMGLKNAASVIAAVILWALTIWIPYVNVGTTIGLVGIVIAMSKGGVINPTGIFASQYRKVMGNFFILTGLMMMAIYAAAIFLIIPAIVLSVSWLLAVYLLIDKDMTPLDALQKSNQLTMGKKWTIFFGLILLAIITMVIVGVLFWVGSQISDILGIILGVIGYLFYIPIMMGGVAHVYRELAGTA